MQQSAVYDLLTAKPHEPDAARFTAEQFRVYREGYAMALTMALRVMELAGRRFALYTRTRQLESRRRREQAR
jgi:hypothetical protein